MSWFVAISSIFQVHFSLQDDPELTHQRYFSLQSAHQACQLELKCHNGLREDLFLIECPLDLHSIVPFRQHKLSAETGQLLSLRQFWLLGTAS